MGMKPRPNSKYQREFYALFATREEADRFEKSILGTRYSLLPQGIVDVAKHGKTPGESYYRTLAAIARGEA